MQWFTVTLCALAIAMEIAIHWNVPAPFSERFAPALSLPASIEMPQPPKPKDDELPIQMRVV
jgi:hypothetical protein